ncbi:MAG TPA: L,D-transpeptidase family protein [Planctomycetota bacterium]|nr:L,D-transpeptidase family protein [Planctomycetota bacterium]
MVTSSNVVRTSAWGAALLALVAGTGCGAEEAGSGAQDTGFLRVAEAAQPQPDPTPAPQVAAGEAQGSRTPETEVSEQPAQPAPKPAAVKPDAQASSKAAAAWSGPAPDASDLELAAALLQRPYSDFAAALQRRGESLPTVRRDLLAAFSAAVWGQTQAAHEVAARLEGSPALAPGERQRLERALQPAVGRPVEASLATTASPLERAMDLALLARAAREESSAGRSSTAAALWSELLLAEIQSPWPTDREALRDWSEALMQAQRSHRWNPRGEWPSIEVTVRPGDSLIAIRKRVLAERPELLLCTGLIARANGLANEDSIRPGDELRVPTDRASALVDLSSRWAFYLLGNEVVAAWEVGVGKQEGSTRVGTYTIGDKQREPMWFQAGREPVPFGDPENPLGTRWLAWNENGKGTSLGFHGTTDPDGVGGRVSQGCVRMHNADVEVLYEVLPRDATVVVRP